MSRASSAFDDGSNLVTPRWAEALARILDSAYVIPGTRIRIGIDAVLGLLLPGAGDAATALATSAFVWSGLRRGVPKVILLRMVVNLAIDAILGAIPIVGDLFDVFHRAASKNLNLLRKYAVEGRQPGFGDYALATAIFSGIALASILPLVLLVGSVVAIARWAGL